MICLYSLEWYGDEVTKNRECLIIPIIFLILGCLTLATEPWNKNEPSILDGFNYGYKAFFDFNNISCFSDQGYAYVLLLKGWKLIFGDSRFSLRFPSLLSYALTIFLIYRICLPHGRSLAIFSSLIFALNSSVAMNAQHLRWYSLSTFLFALSIFFLTTWLKERNYINLLLCIAISLLNVFVLFTSILGFIVILAICIFTTRESLSKSKAILITTILIATFPFVFQKALAVINYRFIIRKLAEPVKLEWFGSFTKLSDLFSSDILVGLFASESAKRYFYFFVIIFFALGLWEIYRERSSLKWVAPLLFLSVVSTYLILLFLDAFRLQEIESRYFVYLAPLYSVVLAKGLLIFHSFKTQILLLLFYGTFQVYLIYNLSLGPLYVDFIKALEYLREKSKEDKIYACAEPSYLLTYINAILQHEKKQILLIANCAPAEIRSDTWKIELKYTGIEPAGLGGTVIKSHSTIESQNQNEKVNFISRQNLLEISKMN